MKKLWNRFLAWLGPSEEAQIAAMDEEFLKAIDKCYEYKQNQKTLKRALGIEE